MGKLGILATASLMFNVISFFSLVRNIYITHKEENAFIERLLLNKKV